MTDQIVDAHRDRIAVQREPSSGTAFRLCVSSLGGEPVASEETEWAEPQTMDIRVVIVEDEVAIAAGLEALLEIEGATVKVVHRGLEAVDAIDDLDPDIVILDISLPDCSGTEVYEQIARRWPRLPVIFSSGHAGALELESYLENRNTTMLVKPYEFETLRKAMTSLLPGLLENG